MIYLFLFCFALKGQNNTKKLPFSHKKQFTQIIKTNPIVHNKGIELLYRGWHLGYETSMDIKHLSSFFSVKYQFRYSAPQEKQRFLKFEYQPRLWTTTQMENFFIAPSCLFYSTGDFAWGGLIGFQKTIQKRYSFELWLGFQRTTPLENFIGDVFIRIGGNFGFVIVNKY